ncbi:FAD-binding protein, partial [Saccharothrix sp. NRRL B-16314]|uniref:FAD-binding protein n=1 Tax=Saccharothrix sp. NRRL B-16314 TaxID=1463825 RepID=UPI000527B4D2
LSFELDLDVDAATLKQLDAESDPEPGEEIPDEAAKLLSNAKISVTVESGTPLKRLNVALAREGLSLTNMGDIMEQTVAGATSTGTHGTGRESASIAAQIRELEL